MSMSKLRRRAVSGLGILLPCTPSWLPSHSNLQPTPPPSLTSLTYHVYSLSDSRAASVLFTLPFPHTNLSKSLHLLWFPQVKLLNANPSIFDRKTHT
ncbi:hypothetical protein DM02DRAFT_618773 [Periconia macrospinosa]|uniref:Uncharacterized protein n=1 Tax=Periconia macrospinosa TaxID=97972 RepID=A0A2V1D9P4_9PLEO|nr:hypothetical protein DM02DRAFT_618773 [Periconia macrospinosa]